jgi:chromosomal replication initiator protein
MQINREIKRDFHEQHKARRARLGMENKPNLVILPKSPKEIEQAVIQEEAERIAKRKAEMDEFRKASREQDNTKRLLNETPEDLIHSDEIFIRIPTLLEVRQEVCAYFNVTRADLLGLRRNGSTILARHFCCYLSRQLTGASYTQIGRAFLRDHSSVIHACEKMQGLVQSSASIQEQYKYFESRLAIRNISSAYWGA